MCNLKLSELHKCKRIWYMIHDINMYELLKNISRKINVLIKNENPHTPRKNGKKVLLANPLKLWTIERLYEFCWKEVRFWGA